MKRFISTKQLFTFLGIVTVSYGIVIGLAISEIIKHI